MAKIFNISTFKTASRCWIPANQSLKTSLPRHFSSRQRCINFNNVSEANLVSNDDVMASAPSPSISEEVFEPTIHSHDEITTPGTYNKP